MKDIYRSDSPESRYVFRNQTAPKPQEKPKPKETPKPQEKPKPKVPAQQPVLGRKNWNPNAPTTYPN